jgi:hypothetical protein
MTGPTPRNLAPEDRLRNALRAEFAAVPPPGDLAERILAGSQPGTEPERAVEDGIVTWLPPATDPVPGWPRGWLVPMIAAAAVLLLVVGGALLVTHGFDSDSAVSPAVSGTPNTSVPVSPQVTPKVPIAPVAPSVTAKPSSSSPVPASGGPVPTGFHAVDLSWVSLEEGWALGTAPCTTAPCTSLLRTTDGGAHWVGLPAPVAELQGSTTCVQACVSALRFATPLIGYAFGQSVLFLTTDGGEHWIKQAGGGASALEISNGIVIRVSTTCTPGCPYTVSRASVGGNVWTAVALPASTPGDGVQLVRSGDDAVLAAFGHTAGGADSATSTVFTSADNGAHWASIGEPCPQGRTSNADPSAEVDSTAVSLAPDGSFAVLCAPRGANSSDFVLTAKGISAALTRHPAATIGYGTALAASSANVVLVGSDTIYRSTNSGQSWVRQPNDGTGPGPVLWIGFESPAVGRALRMPTDAEGIGAATLWTTTDAGRTWRATGFHA